MTENNKLTSKENKKAPLLDIYDIFQCIISAVVMGILLFVFVVRVIGVDGSSMFPTLHNRDKIIASDLFYSPAQGDIVILKTESYKDALVKRVIATEGQTIDIDFEKGIVYVDGVALEEPYINEKTYEREDFEGPVTVPEGCVFVMGDNRNDSSDSRKSNIGFIDERNILGKVYWLIIPGGDGFGELNWSRFGSVY